MSLYDVPPQELVEKTAEALKSIDAVKPPFWAQFAKTGAHAEKPPVRDDWWYVRAASILRKIAILGPVGVSKLRVKYGAKKNKGYAPERFVPAAGNHIRKILQQLEKAGFAKQEKKGQHRGRIITPKGMSFLDKVASEIMKEKGITLPKRPETPLETMMPKEPRKPRAKKAVKKPAEKKVEAAPVGELAEAKAPKKPRAPRKKKTAPEALPAQETSPAPGTPPEALPAQETSPAETPPEASPAPPESK